MSARNTAALNNDRGSIIGFPSNEGFGPVADPIRLRLSRWKQKLIDQTLRNPLLNFRPSKVTTVRIVDEKPTEVFRTLQLEGKTMIFKAVSEEEKSKQKQRPVEFSVHRRSDLDARHTDTELQTELNSETLDLNLLRIYQKATSLFEEQGFSSLCLSVGMLEWFDSGESETPLHAPIVLLPVQLNRETARSKFSLQATQDDPVLNPAIVEKLRTSLRLQLPQLPDSYEEFEPLTYFESFQKAISEQKNWRVTEDINLGFFAFQKFVMYKDMEIAEKVYAEHEIIQALCNAKFEEELENSEDNVEDKHLDEVLTPETTFQVMDADSSQQQAIVAARCGKNLVVEGPPGTGKSQTITNLIAETLAEGKTILFVSEKMAALEVVFNRLESAGLTDFCLELHSNKTSKKTVYEEFQRVLDSARPADHAEDTDLTRLRVLRTFLTEYTDALHKPYGKLDLPPYKAIGEVCLLETAPVVNSSIAGIADCTKDLFEDCCRTLKQHTQLSLDIGALHVHPWRGCELLSLSGSEQDDIYDKASETNLLLRALRQKCDEFAEEIGATSPLTLGQAEVLFEIGASLVRSPGTSESLLMNTSWNTITKDVAVLLERGQRYSELKDSVLSWFSETLLEEDFSQFLQSYRQHCQQWYRHWKPSFWKLRKYFRRYFNMSYRPHSNDQLLTDLSDALQCREDMMHIRDQNERGRELFGDKWNSVDSNWRQLKEFAEWIVSVRHFILEEALSARGISLAASGIKAKESVTTSVQEIRRVLDEIRAKLSYLCDTAKFESIKPTVLGARSEIEALSNWTASLATGIKRIHEWVALNQSTHTCNNSIASTFFAKFYEQNIDVQWLESAFRKCFLRRWLDLPTGERPILAKFQPSRHEDFITEFRGLDKRALELAKQRLRYILCQRRDKLLKSKELEEELRILQRQMRTRSKLPLRKLFKQVPSVIRAIKPCFMMSPMSAALFLDPSNTPFDVVIFDEASQITTEDAVGAVVRGRQLVVVGDTKQLPPTNFFMVQLSEEPQPIEGDERNELQIIDLESVLDECIATGFPARKLKWHYRSRHESLITFSNRKFYDGELLTFPGPDTGVEERGLAFEFVGGTYEGSGVNSKEANAIADAVCHHIKTTPELSLGVGTFNVKQQTFIKDELDRRRREDPTLEFFFARKGEDEFFVKNLENIQGDDRDVIFLSITYGPGSDGKTRYNFGPINGQNGWRRLNVILTRAKLRLKVFSSMRGEDIDPTRATSDGARHLRDFLLFAEREVLITPEIDDRALIQTPFEQAVFDELTRKNLRLVPQVGHAGYKVDFGVLDQDIPGRFLIGIECDGATYHSAATARDRDRLRQQILEGLGWKLIRIWSTDWFRNREVQINRVLDFVQRTKEALAQDNTETDTESSEEEPREKTRRVELPVNPQHPPSATTANKVDRPALSMYTITTITVLGDSQSFSSASDYTVSGIIQRVIDQEVPIHLDELKKRVAAHWQISRVGSRIDARLDRLIQALVTKRACILRKTFIWKNGQNDVSARVRKVDSYTFSADSLPPEEIDSCISYVLADYKPRSKEEIVTEVARTLGFGRAGQKLADSILARIEQLLETSQLETCSTGLRLAQRPG